jgi:hypothetical protein
MILHSAANVLRKAVTVGKNENFHKHPSEEKTKRMAEWAQEHIVKVKGVTTV